MKMNRSSKTRQGVRVVWQWQDWWRSGRTGGAVFKGATPLPELLEGLILSWAANPHLSSGLVTALRAFMMLTCWD